MVYRLLFVEDDRAQVDLFEEALRGGVLLQQDVIVALERYELH